MNREKKSRISMWIPCKMAARLESDSQQYGITKTALVQNMIAEYYRNRDLHNISAEE